MIDLVLNGRFLGRPITGVDRVAIELARALRELLIRLDAPDALEVVLPPQSAARTGLGAIADRSGGLPSARSLGSSGGHAWEQLFLQRYRPRAWLLNLCNTAPMLRRRQLVIIHDAQAFSQPQSYSRVFRTWYSVLMRMIGRKTQVIVTVSHHSQRMLEQYGIVPAGKARVIYNGGDHMQRLVADDTILDRFDLTPQGYFLAIGSLARHKNVARLVEAFVAAKIDGVRLVVAGGGNPTVFRDAGLPVADNVTYLGRVTDAELKSLYTHAMAFACPSITEGFGLPALEAMTIGCPVIATTGGAVPEVCGEAALYVDPLDTAGWTAALRRVAADPALRAKMARQSLARSVPFTWDVAAREVLTHLARHDGDTAMLDALSADDDGGR